MSDYTPTTGDIEIAYAERALQVAGTPHFAAGLEFDAWLAAHDREVAAKALRDAADVLDRPRVIWYGDGGVTVLEAGTDATLDDYRAERPTVVEWLRARAVRQADATEGTTPTHVGGRVNAEHCPACSPTIDPPPYPWICPGPNETEGTTT